ncbi:hypothetical protein [Nonomuraea typhae]|uniref:hypothetical protein n=1 Tax=Nonomuraea typhae TaxID=2603600 RepID=UPI0012F7BF67|nr:hypothetical protein [Nonomuraea typhae]
MKTLIWLRNRWPTALALGATALTFGGGESGEMVTSFAGTLLILPLLYLVVAKLKRREATWPGLLAGIVLVFVLRFLDVIEPAVVYSGLALVVLIWGAVDGHLRASGELRLQALGMLGFGALALAGLILDPDVGRYVVAAGWFLHGVWDFVHLKRDKVVARSFAEWCGVVDVVIAAELVFKL